jgi:glycosyltransferase involved in cell wall biosynthesis
MLISCITSTTFIQKAKDFATNEFNTKEVNVLDIKDIILQPSTGLKELFRKKDIVIGFMLSEQFSQAIDLIICFTSISRAKEKYVCYFKDSVFEKLKLGTIIRAFLNVMRDAVCIPFFMILARARILQFTEKRNNVLKDVKDILYVRTDVIGELKVGGSVAHTTGVIEGFKRLGYNAQMIFSGTISALKEQENITFVKKDSLLRNVPEISNIAFSEKVYRGALEKQDEVEFIYQRYSMDDYTGALLSKKLNLPFILEYNGSDVWVAKHWGTPLLFEKMAEKIEIANLKAADLIVVVSEPLRDELLKRGIEADKIVVNPNGVDELKYNPDIDSRAIRERYQLRDKTVIGFIGTFGKWHGAEVLAKAVKGIITEKKEVHFLFIGDGVTLPEVKDIIEKDGMSEYVTYTGLIEQERAPQYLAACDILVSPHVPNPDGTPFFGSPTKLFEYMAMGKAIVASDLDQIGEVLEHGKTAWMVRPGDVVDLAGGIVVLAGSEKLRTELGRNARKEVVEKYTWTEHVGKIVAALETVLEKKKS